MLRGNFEQENACKCDHRVDVVWYTDQGVADVVVCEYVFEDRGGGCDSGYGAGFEVWSDGATFEAAEDVGVEMELCEMVMKDYPLCREFADAFVELWGLLRCI